MKNNSGQKSLSDLLNIRKSRDFAVEKGTLMHVKLRRITIADSKTYGDIDVIKQIKKHPELLPFFSQNAKTEIAVAGKIHGKFVSRRIDRLCIDDSKKTVLIMDYKTDIDKDIFHSEYVDQVREYKELLHAIYPDYNIRGFILWLKDFSLEEL